MVQIIFSLLAIIAACSVAYKFSARSVGLPTRRYAEPFQKEAPSTARELSQFKNKIPFSDEIYEEIKFVIAVLQQKASNVDKVLKQEDASKFVVAVAAILEDAHKYGPPPRPKPIPEDAPPI